MNAPENVASCRDAEAAGLPCPLCGGPTADADACGGCPLACGCDVVRCARCGYGFPRTSRIVNALRWLIGRMRKP